jgi:hypothetical protein
LAAATSLFSKAAKSSANDESEVKSAGARAMKTKEGVSASMKENPNNENLAESGFDPPTFEL